MLFGVLFVLVVLEKHMKSANKRKKKQDRAQTTANILSRVVMKTHTYSTHNIQQQKNYKYIYEKDYKKELLLQSRKREKICIKKHMEPTNSSCNNCRIRIASLATAAISC